MCAPAAPAERAIPASLSSHCPNKEAGTAAGPPLVPLDEGPPSELEWSASEGVSTDDTAETLLVSREEKNAFLSPFSGHKRNK